MYKKRQLATKTEIRIYCAASYFAFVSQDVSDIANAFGLTNNRAVYQWAETEQWDKALDMIGYRGNRTLKKKRPGRKSSEVREMAREAYHALSDRLSPAEMRKHLKLFYNQDSKTIYNWVRQFEKEASNAKKNV